MLFRVSSSAELKRIAARSLQQVPTPAACLPWRKRTQKDRRKQLQLGVLNRTFFPPEAVVDIHIIHCLCVLSIVYMKRAAGRIPGSSDDTYL